FIIISPFATDKEALSGMKPAVAGLSLPGPDAVGPALSGQYEGAPLSLQGALPIFNAEMTQNVS
ncbi:MAG TPA: hypothetical protein VIS78_05130, partial [Blastocatellia bacterium]